MTKKEIVEALKPYFKIEELVSKDVLEKYGESRCWGFFNAQLLETLLIIRRDILQCSMTVNNWKKGGSYSQRGLRANMDSMMLDRAEQYFKAKLVDKKSEKELEALRKKLYYLTAHTLVSGLDFSCSIPANDARNKIVENQDLLPYPIRLENNESAPTWVHFDLCTMSEDKITFFKG